MDKTAHKWTEADFPDNEGILAVGDDVYYTPQALAKRLCWDVEKVRDRIRRKRIPSIAGLADGERLVPMSMLKDELDRRKDAANLPTELPAQEHPNITPGARYAAESLSRRRK